MITVESRNIAVIYSSKNKKGLHDATGAFIPEARAFQLVHGIPDNNMCGVDCVNQKVEQRRKQVLEHIYCVGRNEPLDGLAFFCHGWSNGIQVGFNRNDLSLLAGVVAASECDYLETVLYACSTKKVAKHLAFLFAARGVRGHVDAHDRRGHTTINPYVVRAQNMIASPHSAWLVEPGSEFWRAWVNAMQGTNMRFEFPFMTELEIKMQLAGKL